MKISAKPGLTSRDISLAYDEFFKQKGLLRDSDTYYRWVLSKISFRPGQRVLDVACGEGLLVKFAREQGLIAVGIDLSLQGTILAREFVNDTIITQANGEELPFASESFDIVTNLGSLEHFQDAETGLKEMIRVLRPGGQAVTVLPNSYYLVDILWEVWRTGYGVSHKQPLERFASFGEWREFIQRSGLRVIKAYKYNFCFPRSSADWAWYRQHPRKLLNLLVSPFIPFNLSNHFLYVCSRD